MNKNSTLHLTLHSWWFNEIYQGRKKNEYRADNKFWQKRLLNPDGSIKQFERIMFINGYGKHRPFMVVEWLGCEQLGEFDIKLGKLLTEGNMQIFKTPTKPPKGFEDYL